MEYDAAGVFEDKGTRIVLNRDFETPEYRVIDNSDSLEIITDHLHLTYNKEEFSASGLQIELRGNFSAYHSIWRYGDTGNNLKGTARTLDEADGPIDLEDGLLSRNGYAIIDDSKSIIIEEDGWVAPRISEAVDLYFFGYGRDYLGCLRDFYQLSGPTPMLPRYSLGNWWSRFYRYTETSYKELIQGFENEGVPFSMAVIDMDWHITEVDSKYGSGWTGYTWNKNYFEDPERFMNWLHDKGLHVTLNVHPADGVRAFEEMYLDMAKALGVDYANEDKIPFDISSPTFLEAYFKYLHHTNEDMGVDFWWIDWQQGSNTRVAGLDPLWMLNHYHYLDNMRKNKYPLILSRYAGIGSHRYPIGFSGDSFATWESLDFQPYFTATASNAGYGWWSHDIGGHMHGIKNDEMATRWIQYGVFSPILRIHSSDNPFNEKQPWKYNLTAEKTMKRFLRLRHQLIPYLYTMNQRFHDLGEPLVQPMYYKHAEAREAYEVPNQYYFGSSLIACPITTPTHSSLGLGCFKAWLPEGTYYDFFTGYQYEGGRRIDLYRAIEAMPIFAKAGTIIPLTAEHAISNDTSNPSDLEVQIFVGGDGQFSMYEDALESNNHQVLTANTNYEFNWSEKQFAIHAYEGDEGVLPAQRNYTLCFVGLEDTEQITIMLNGKTLNLNKQYDLERKALMIHIKEVNVKETLQVQFHEAKIASNDYHTKIFKMLNAAQIEFDLKDCIYQVIKKHTETIPMMMELKTLNLEDNLLGALFELLGASNK